MNPSDQNQTGLLISEWLKNILRSVSNVFNERIYLFSGSSKKKKKTTQEIPQNVLNYPFTHQPVTPKCREEKS